MPEFPADPLSRIDSMVEIIGIAHAAIFTQHRRLIDLGLDDEGSRGLLDESIKIVFTDAPSATRRARALAERWGEQQLLDPGRAGPTRDQLATELEQSERRLEGLLARQEEIARELRERAGGGTD
jgi:hypothetical protein